MKLYLVKCRGMQSSVTGTPHGVAYVLADDPSHAYAKLRHFLDNEKLGFDHERELDAVALIADDAMYPDCRTRLIQ